MEVRSLFNEFRRRLVSGASFPVFYRILSMFFILFLCLPPVSLYGSYSPVYKYLPLAAAKSRAEVPVAKHRRGFVLNQYCRVKNRKSLSSPRSKFGKTRKNEK